jgi:hypothetical protein
MDQRSPLRSCRNRGPTLRHYRNTTIAQCIRSGCAIDHSLWAIALFCDGQHKRQIGACLLLADLTTTDHCECGDVTSQSHKNHKNQQRLQIENQDNKDGYNSNRCCDPNIPPQKLLKHGSYTLLLFSSASRLAPLI